MATNRKEYMDKWRANNMDKIRAYDRKRYSIDSGPKLDRANNYYASNRDEVKAKHRAYYLAHKDEARESNRRRRANNRQEVNQKELERRERIFAEKAGRPRASVCEVCGAGDVKIVYDHDHSTGDFRGWICFNCNTALGHARDNIEVLKKLINYLETSRGSPKESELVLSPIQLTTKN
jgi:hypothetical protein